MKCFEKKLFYIVLLGFIISIIPIFVLGFYAFPFYDDFNHGYLTYAAVNEGKGLFEILIIAFKHMQNIYYTWQGTYTAIFLSAFQPGIFGENWYFLTPVIIIFTQVLSTLYLCKVLFKDYLNMNNYKTGIISIFILFFQIQNLPSAFEGYFWWASAIMHTFSYNMLLLYIALMLSVIRENNCFKCFALIILAFLIGGGAYEIALFAACLVVLVIIAYFIYCKLNHIKINKMLIFELIIILFVSTVGLLINISAPGNIIRMEDSGVKISALSAIIKSFIYSIIHTFEYISLKTIIISIIVAIFSYDSLKKMNFVFVKPFIFIIMTWCAYSIIFTPAIYGENYVASPRYLNVLYFTFYWFLILDILYILYYYKDNFSKICWYINKLIYKNQFKAIIVIISLSISAIFQFSYLDATGSCAIVDIITGNAAAFKNTNEERVKILEDDSSNIAIIPKMSNNVRLFETDNLTEDSQSYFNKMYARYYDKVEVKVGD